MPVLALRQRRATLLRRRAFLLGCVSPLCISLCRSWSIDKKGELALGRAREKAHKDRVSAILAAEGFLYSVSWDGSVKMWDAQVETPAGNASMHPPSSYVPVLSAHAEEEKVGVEMMLGQEKVGLEVVLG